MDSASPARTHPPVRVQCVDGVWWFVDATGAPFVSLGVNHVQPNCWLAPYNREASLARYGADLATPDWRFNVNGAGIRLLMRSLVARLKRWGFNSLGMHLQDVPVDTYADELYSVACTDACHLGSRFRFGTDHFPDCFAPEFERRVEEAVAACCARHRANARLIGYAFSDIPRWYHYPDPKGRPPPPIHAWVDDLRSLPPAAPGRRRWVELLRARYPDAQAAGRVHGAPLATWDDALTLPRWPAPADPEQAKQDAEALLALAARRWYAVHAAAIRRQDPGRLVLGDKLHSPHVLPAWFAPILREFVDVVLIQWYQPCEVQRKALWKLHRETGLPILNGDSGFCWPEPPRRTRVKGFPVASREAVGDAYRDYLRAILSLPFMLGWHFCGIMEQWDGASRGYAWEPNENGLMDPFEQPHEAIVTNVAAANAQAHAWHSAAGHA
jgi:hypothetical protein